MTASYDGLTPAAIAGRGNGLIATRDFEVGERLFVATAFGFAKDEQQDSRECCAHCLCFGEHLPVRCPCSTLYCSVACQNEDALLGHAFCCKALESIAAILPKDVDFSCQVRSSAEFLLRAFAARRAAAATAAAAPGAISPTQDFSFESALSQCRDDPRTTKGYERREEARERAVSLASLHAGGLMRRRHGEAMSLLRSEPCNSYNLRDDFGKSHGWVRIPAPCTLPPCESGPAPPCFYIVSAKMCAFTCSAIL